jgi:hypothetical protein
LIGEHQSGRAGADNEHISVHASLLFYAEDRALMLLEPQAGNAPHRGRHRRTLIGMGAFC